MTCTGEDLDGRRLRRSHNREAVLDALTSLFNQGSYQPSTNDIAERAGLSARSLFRYFDDVDDLNRAVIERHLRRARPLADIEVEPDQPTSVKVRRLVETRVQLFETIAPEARACRLWAHRHRVVAAQLQENRAYFRQQIRALFPREVQGPGATLLPILDVLCSFESYELLRNDQGLSRRETVSTLVAAMCALLSPAEASP